MSEREIRGLLLLTAALGAVTALAVRGWLVQLWDVCALSAKVMADNAPETIAKLTETVKAVS